MSVDIRKIEDNLASSFDVNDIFDANNIGKDNTVEDKIVNFSMKLSNLIDGIDLTNFYEKIKTLKLEPLSKYSNKGFVDYDPLTNTGFINIVPLEKDDENNFNVDNLFSQIMLMTATSKDHYYGFDNDGKFAALNRACTYMIASNISGCATSNYDEEELTLLNMLSLTLELNNQNSVDFIDAYFTNNGTVLKQELAASGIGDSILDQINHLSESKMSHTVIPERFSEIVNQVNKNYAKILSTKSAIESSIVEKYKSNLFNDEVLDYSDCGVLKATENMNKAIEYLRSKMSHNKENEKIVQKIA